ncbi:MAG: DUF368 domain-containing protein [bacterium]|nr:DUF368 domain-containing protein [bacterium]
MASTEQTERGLKEYVLLGLKGFCMGAADVVPGVSGGTIAFITGIYQELNESIKSIEVQLVRQVLRFQWKAALSQVGWSFLATVLGGILVAIFSLAKGITWMLDNHPILTWAFFFGLVLASVLTVSKRVNAGWGGLTYVASGGGAVAAYLLVGLVPVETPNALWFVFLSGLIAICAMILPGISGSFLLVLMGKYQFLLAAVNNREGLVLGTFSLGAAIGIMSFARVLSWVFRRYHDLAIALLTGLMVGSLRKVWPWKETLTTMLNRHGKEIPVLQVNIFPKSMTGEVALAVALGGLGFVLVLALDRLAASKPEA